MNFRFSGRKISGILTVVPANEVPFEAEIGNYNFSPAKSMKLKLAMGYNKHRIVAGRRLRLGPLRLRAGAPVRQGAL